MSYEGTVEYLCSKGHYYTKDVHNNNYVCTQCGANPEWVHHINETNGRCLEFHQTRPADKKTFGFEDQWCKDHYGNSYAVTIDLYEPASPYWRKV